MLDAVYMALLAENVILGMSALMVMPYLAEVRRVANTYN
jgi:hypothetical protein